jgi:hypothetical protein
LAAHRGGGGGSGGAAGTGGYCVPHHTIAHTTCSSCISIINYYTYYGGDGGKYGGGRGKAGGGSPSSCVRGTSDYGAVRIVWPGATRTFPTTCVSYP